MPGVFAAVTFQSMPIPYAQFIMFFISKEISHWIFV